MEFARDRRHATALTILWILIAIYAVVADIPQIQPPVTILVLVPFLFAVIHGSLRYGARAMAVFVVICLVVSNVFENLSIVTGFPFGHYQYTESLGPKLFLVPLLIGPAYFGAGYTAWMLANILLGESDHRRDLLSVVGTPIVGSFIMAGWDVTMDPTSSTVNHSWIWRDGGGYFGVPLVNYLGWYLTVFGFLQLFALFVARSARPVESPQTREYWYQPAVFFAAMALRYPTQYLVAQPARVQDATGTMWGSSSIAESAAIVSLYTMIFAAVAAFLKVAQRAP